ncbi:cobalamin biosynthesis protein CobD/CbiB [Azospirillum argentinense]|uniref:Cobalamin biosynthesis protein CobD n=1 Tax=Azospirillum argentinense TaxID=2970906 RepID=A0A5B0L1Q4_9PROT|nr:CobD/CbiB family cobalamin biosynthesis protein [Azospirillum argentinense]KAA1057863.1 Adenosylcobinamide-phosphate synthase [Azospirillum argentinense]
MGDALLTSVLGAAPLNGPGPLFLLLLALAIDAAAGDWIGRVLPDPAALAQRVCAWADRRLNRVERGKTARLLRGALVVLALVLAAVAIGLIVERIGAQSRGWLLELAVILATLRGRSAWARVRAVRRALDKGGVAPARDAVAPLTRRHAFSLDEHGIARAAIEAAAKGFARKLVAPVFGYALLGVPGLLVWAVVDGADTALGHAGVRHERFGQTAARLDDALNAIPARLAAVLLALAAPFAGARAGGAFRTMMRDGGKAASLNMGWPTAAMAGALGLALGGPHRDGGVVITEPWIGEGRARATAADIGRALAVYAVAGLILALLVALLLWGIAGL